MLNANSFLAADFGAGSLKLAEFEVNEAGGLRLKRFILKPLGLEGAQEATREATVLKALREGITELGAKSKVINVCAPGFQVFSKFVKLPPVDAGKVNQMIQYEAQQNVPFPLSEVVWDYQILGSSATGELEVLLVAIKSEVVEGLFRVTEQAKLQLQLCDVSPAALCNAFRFNYAEIEECTMLLDIGAKTSNLLFFEKGKVFSRSISLGANAITQDFASEAKLKFDPAEQIKVKEGFVSLGGAYEEPENENQAAISKIARQFMTKLHIQVNQTMQYYRGQMGGSAPQRLFLSGGASIMPYTAQFFQEKLNVQAEYFNPFRNVQIDPTVNLEELVRVAHSMGEVVGLGLRNLANCPVELNLMPDSTLRWQAFNQKKPYFFFTMLLLVLVVGMVGFLFQKLAKTKNEAFDNLQPQVQTATDRATRFHTANAALEKSRKEMDQITAWMEARYFWGNVLPEFRAALVRSEEDVKKKLSAQKPGTEAGIWIEKMLTVPLGGEGVAMQAAPTTGATANPYANSAAYGNNNAAATPAPAAAAAPATPNDGQLDTITLICRAVNLSSVDPSANNDIAYAVENELKASPWFDPKTTQLSGQITADDATGTFTFGVTVTLKTPLKL
jgi:type IV pilus assembly protein PilM